MHPAIQANSPPLIGATLGSQESSQPFLRLHGPCNPNHSGISPLHFVHFGGAYFVTFRVAPDKW